jgi:hypothetical protein
MSRRTVLVLAGILLVQSVVVARVFTPQPHDGGDNAGYISLAYSILERGAYLELWDPAEPPHSKYPPVLALLLAMAMVMGAKSWAALKLVPAFSTVLAVAFTFLWANGRRGWGMGLGVALLLGLSESVVYYSQWILSDPTFLALTFGALWALHQASKKAGNQGPPEQVDRFLGLGMVLVVLAYFTRSAGLPLVVATFLWLVLRRRWKPLAWFVFLFGVPAVLWWIRGSLGGGGEYVSEFWMIDPYRPDLGTVGPGALFSRVMENLVAYPTRIIPAGIAGDGLAFLTPLGLGLALLALVGWLRAVREGVGVAELFSPLYFGLILFWPPTWSGDRFSLPLLPLMFFYSGGAVLWMLGSFRGRVRGAVVGALAVLLALPAVLEWNRMGRLASMCRDTTGMGSVLECLPPAQGEYFALAEWSGRNLPDDAVVTARKPRTFFLMSGVKAQSIPMVTGAEEFLDRLRQKGSRYVTLDLLDGVSVYYVDPVLLERPSAFCWLAEVGATGETGTQLLGLVDLGEVPRTEEEIPVLTACQQDMQRASPIERESLKGWEIPLLVWRSQDEE